MGGVYEPDAGDLAWSALDPRVGREQGGRRPVLVISPIKFWRAGLLAIVCPVTRRVRPFASSVVLPVGLPVQGEVLTSHVRSVDTTARPMHPTGASVPPAVLPEVRAKLAALIGLTG